MATAESSWPPVFVLATGMEPTMRALNRAAAISRERGSRTVLLVPHVGAFHAGRSGDAAASARVHEYRELAREADVDASVCVCACRRIGDIFRQLVDKPSTIVIGAGAPSWFRTDSERRLASTLTREGHSVVLEVPSTRRNGQSGRTIMRLLKVPFLSALIAIGLCAAARAQQQPTATAPDPAKKPDPFAFADFTWLSGNPRTKESPLDTKPFTGEFRVDTNFTYSFNKPSDDTIAGSSEIFRSGEFQVTQLGLGGDFHYDNVQGRLMTQFGMYAQTTPRNDASPGRGQWDLNTAYRYLSEAYGGYHFDAMNGVNVQAGIFMSYIGLWSYYNFDNWTYQPSYVSSNTPWFFNGMRIQIFPNDKLKIEPWLINGWQSYGKFNHAPGVGGQILWRPSGSVSILANNYWGTDTLGNPDRKRIHTDDSIQWKYYDKPDQPVSKAAMTFTFDGGCEYGGGVACRGGDATTPSQFFVGFMAYNRLWFDHDRFALTFGGGAIDNPGRYLVLMPPINGATAFSGTPYLTYNPGDPFKAWDTQTTFDFMPSQFVTFRAEYNYRHANVPYFAGEGGVTPPGGNTGAPGSMVDGWAPDLRPSENRVTFALLVKL